MNDSSPSQGAVESQEATVLVDHSDVAAAREPTDAAVADGDDDSSPSQEALKSQETVVVDHSQDVAAGEPTDDTAAGNDKEKEDNGEEQEEPALGSALVVAAAAPAPLNDKLVLVANAGEPELREALTSNQEEAIIDPIDPPTSSDEVSTSEISNEKVANEDNNSIIPASRQVVADEMNIVGIVEVQQQGQEEGDEQIGESSINQREETDVISQVPIVEDSAAIEAPLASDLPDFIISLDDIVPAATQPLCEETTLVDLMIDHPENHIAEEEKLPQEEALPSVAIVSSAVPNTLLADSTPEFVNRGLQFWETSRKHWQHRNSGDSSESSKAVAIPLDVDEIIDIIFTSPKQVREDGGPRRFPQNVPLPQMIDILVDLWEAEGLDI